MFSIQKENFKILIMKSILIFIILIITFTSSSVIPDGNECFKTHMTTFEPFLNKSLDPQINRIRFEFISTTSKLICMTSDELLEKFNEDVKKINFTPNNLNCYKHELNKLKLLFEPELNLTTDTEGDDIKNCIEAEKFVNKTDEEFQETTKNLYEGAKLKYKTCDEFEVAIHTRMLQNYHLRAIIIKNSKLSENEERKEKLTAMRVLVDLAKEQLMCFYGDLKGGDEN